MDGALVARVDPKKDRELGTLVVLGTHVGPRAPADVAERLGDELAWWRRGSGLWRSPRARMGKLYRARPSLRSLVLSYPLGVGAILSVRFAAPVRYPGDDLGLCVTVANRPIENPTEKRALPCTFVRPLQPTWKR